MKKCGIVVLGNGFDLFHDHKTSYKDFINAIKDEYCNNLWVNYFDSVISSNNWVDIENEFFKILNDMTMLKNEYSLYNYKEPIHIKYRQLFKALGFTCILHTKNGYEKIMVSRSETALRRTNDVFYDKIVISKTKFNFLMKDGNLKFKTIDEKLIKDFLQLKDLLKKYIQDIVIINDTYNSSNSIYQYLNSLDELIVINFNYTNTLDYYNSKINNIFVHGDVRNNIIFGHNHIEQVEYAMFNKQVQQQSFGINYKYEFMKAIDQPEITSCDEYQLHILGHSFDVNDHEVISWIYKYLYSQSKHISRFKYFYYDDGNHTDLISRNLNIKKFFTQSIGTICNIQTSDQSPELLRRLMFEDPTNYCFTGQHEFDYFQRSNNIFKIELK